MFFKSTILVLTVAMASSSLASESPEDLQARSDLLIASDRYYVFNDQVGDFFQSWQHCLALGLQMATVNSAEDDAELAVALRRADPKEKGPYWIAGTDLGKPGHFVWITNGKPVGYTTGFMNFSPGEPNNAKHNEHCLELYAPATKWNDINCFVPHRTICEKAPSKSSTKVDRF